MSEFSGEFNDESFEIDKTTAESLIRGVDASLLRSTTDKYTMKFDSAGKAYILAINKSNIIEYSIPVPESVKDAPPPPDFIESIQALRDETEHYKKLTRRVNLAMLVITLIGIGFYYFLKYYLKVW